MLSFLYIFYIVIRVILNPKLAPKISAEEANIPFSQVIKMLATSFFPLAILIASVLGSILFGVATPTEAAAVGALGAAVLAFAYKRLNLQRIKESVFLTARTTLWLYG